MKKGFITFGITCVTLAMFLSGCSSVQSMFSGASSSSVSNQTYSATDPEHVTLYIDDKPKCHYKELGLVSIRTVNLLGMNLSSDDISHSLKEQAANMGGDAVINVHDTLQHREGTVVRCVK